MVAPALLQPPGRAASGGGHGRNGSYSVVPPAASLSVESDGDGDSDPGARRPGGFAAWFRRGR